MAKGMDFVILNYAYRVLETLIDTPVDLSSFLRFIELVDPYEVMIILITNDLKLVAM